MKRDLYRGPFPCVQVSFRFLLTKNKFFLEQVPLSLSLNKGGTCSLKERPEDMIYSSRFFSQGFLAYVYSPFWKRPTSPTQKWLFFKRDLAISRGEKYPQGSLACIYSPSCQTYTLTNTHTHIHIHAHTRTHTHTHTQKRRLIFSGVHPSRIMFFSEVTYSGAFFWDFFEFFFYKRMNESRHTHSWVSGDGAGIRTITTFEKRKNVRDTSYGWNCCSDQGWAGVECIYVCVCKWMYAHTYTLKLGMCISIRIYTCTDIYTYICMYIYIYIYIYTYIYIYIYIYIWIYTYIYVEIHIYTYIDKHMCIYTYICMCIDIYIYT